jgi:hypothetical protein
MMTRPAESVVQLPTQIVLRIKMCAMPARGVAIRAARSGPKTGNERVWSVVIQST